MSKDFAFLFKPGDYLRDTQCLSEKSQVAYDRIMCEHMRNICITKQQLNFFTKKLSEDEKTELMQVVAVINGGFEIEWVAESIRERMAYSESRRLNREGKTKKHMKHISISYVNHMEGDSNSDNENKINIGFEDFWNAYDKKRGDKIKLELKWISLTDQERENIMTYIPKYKQATPDKKFRKDPQTFFNNKSWNDEIIISNENSSGDNKRSIKHTDKLWN